jgi:hypothetical protein
VENVPRPELELRDWEQRNKHRKATSRNWQAGIEWTKTRDSQYLPELTDEEVRVLEEGCIDEGTVYRDSPHIKKFYINAGRVVGACSGELTTYVFAEWHNTGSFHGRPISIKRLREMGVNVDND